MQKFWILFVVLLMGAAILAGCSSESVTEQISAEPCDRACLENFVEQYLDAAIAHDPGLLPLSEDVKFTENGVQLPLPDAHWKIMTGKGKYRLFVTDPDAGQVACIATIREEGRTEEGVHSQFAIRLRVKNRRITEIETLVARPDMPMGPPGAGAAPRFPSGADLYEEMGQPHPVYLEVIPPDERMSREDLIKTANMYFSGMEQNDGQGEYPFTDDCDRLEGGMQTTNVPLREGQTMPDPETATMYSANWGCREQFESGLLHFVWRIRDRRFVAVDQERGLVFSFVFFDHALGADRTFTLPDGREITAGPMEPNSWQIAELFKIENGLIRRIEALLIPPPYGMNSGWSSYEEGISSEARDVTMSGY
ncbi:MAG: hypothetical protein JXR49_20805 [Acidobacteria bacterium]|nr:hypothetical protein [Acidobacteriota bacterium]